MSFRFLHHHPTTTATQQQRHQQHRSLVPPPPPATPSRGGRIVTPYHHHHQIRQQQFQPQQRPFSQQQRSYHHTPVGDYHHHGVSSQQTIQQRVSTPSISLHVPSVSTPLFPPPPPPSILSTTTAPSIISFSDWKDIFVDSFGDFSTTSTTTTTDNNDFTALNAIKRFETLVEMGGMTLIGTTIFRDRLSSAFESMIERTHDFTDSAYTSHEHRENILLICDRLRLEFNQLLRIGSRLEEEETGGVERHIITVEPTTERTTTSVASSTATMVTESDIETAIVQTLRATNDLKHQLNVTALTLSNELFKLPTTTTSTSTITATDRRPETTTTTTTTENTIVEEIVGDDTEEDEELDPLEDEIIEENAINVVTRLKSVCLQSDFVRFEESIDTFSEHAEHVSEVCKLLAHVAPNDSIATRARSIENSICLYWPQLLNACQVLCFPGSTTTMNKSSTQRNLDVLIDLWLNLYHDVYRLYFTIKNLLNLTSSSLIKTSTAIEPTATTVTTLLPRLPPPPPPPSPSPIAASTAAISYPTRQPIHLQQQRYYHPPHLLPLPGPTALQPILSHHHTIGAPPPLFPLHYPPKRVTIQEPQTMLSSSHLPYSTSPYIEPVKLPPPTGVEDIEEEDPRSPSRKTRSVPDLEDNEIVKLAKAMSEIVQLMDLFTQGEGELKTTQDLFTQAEFFAEEANKFYKIVRHFTYQVPSGSLKKELLENLDKVPTFVQQLQFSVKNSTVGKAATFTKVDNVIRETKNLMNFVTKTVDSCLVCSTKYNLEMVSRVRSRTLSPSRGGYGGDEDYDGFGGGSTSSDPSL